MKKLIGLKGALAVFALISALVLAGCGGEETTKTVYVDGGSTSSGWTPAPTPQVRALTPDQLIEAINEGWKKIAYDGTDGFDLTDVAPAYSMRSGEAGGVTVILTKDFDVKDEGSAITTNGATLYTQNLTISDGSKFIMAGSTSINVDGNLTLKGDTGGATSAVITVNGSATVSTATTIAAGSLNVIGDLAVEKTLTLTSGNLTVGGKTDIKEPLVLTSGNGTFQGDVNNDVSISWATGKTVTLNGKYTGAGIITTAAGSLLATSNVGNLIELAEFAAAANNNLASVSFVPATTGDAALITSNFEILEDGGVVNFGDVPVILKSGKISVGSGATLTLKDMTAQGEVIIASGGAASITGTAVFANAGKFIIQSGADASATNPVIEITGATLKKANVALGSLDLPVDGSTVVVAANPGKTIGSATNKILLNDGGKINIGKDTASVTLQALPSFSTASASLGIGGVLQFAVNSAAPEITPRNGKNAANVLRTAVTAPKYKVGADAAYASLTASGEWANYTDVGTAGEVLFRISGGVADVGIIGKSAAAVSLDNTSAFVDASGS